MNTDSRKTGMSFVWEDAEYDSREILKSTIMV